MSLTTNQQDYLDNLDANFASFRAALVAALEADNDGATDLSDARTMRSALHDGHIRLSKNLGFNELVPSFRPTIVGGTTLARAGSLGNVWLRNEQPIADARIVPQ